MEIECVQEYRYFIPKSLPNLEKFRMDIFFGGNQGTLCASYFRMNAVDASPWVPYGIFMGMENI